MFSSLLFNTLLLSNLAAAVALPPLKRQDDDVSIGGTKLKFFGCDEIHNGSKNMMYKDIYDTWKDAIKLASSVRDIDTRTDFGSFDC